MSPRVVFRNRLDFVPPGGILPPLQLSHLTYKGAFRFPATDEHNYSIGLMVRLRAGTPHVYAFGAYPPKYGHLLEINIPDDGDLGFGTTYTNFPIATPSVDYGDIFQDKLYQENDDQNGPGPKEGLAGGAFPNGMFWDYIRNKVIWTRITGYDNESNTDNAFGEATLDDIGFTGTSLATWKPSLRGTFATANVGERFTSGATLLSQPFADAYTGGRRLCLGFGGNWSIISQGPLSIGPALIAIPFPDLAFDPDRDFITRGIVRLLWHPWANLSDIPKRGARPSNRAVYQHDDDGYVGTPAAYYWTRTEQTRGVYIYGTQREGYLQFSSGAGGYANTTLSNVVSHGTWTFPGGSSDTGVDVFDVVDPGDTRVGDIVLWGTDGTVGNLYPWAGGIVTAISGNRITAGSRSRMFPTDPATDPGAPTNGGDFICGTRYVGGGPMQSRIYNMAASYSPSTLGSNAGSTSTHGINVAPDELVDWQFAGQAYPLAGTFSGGAPNMNLEGIAWEPTTRRLYIKTKQGTQIDANNRPLLVHVYDVDC